ncbi:hypothetical protein OF83DRAFT_614442 [Amylostereum chailletii]|nr:hypothetical protein OF83DRAFT_614442 [Amylostereum chailletii]
MCMFFAYRIYFLSGRQWIVPALICLLSLAHLVLGGIVYVINALKLVFFASSSPNLPFGISALGLDMACDFIIAITMTHYLRRGRANINVRTNSAIRLLIIYTMNTCLLTTVCATACLVSLVASSDTLIYTLFFFVLARLYLCSLMTTLNSRTSSHVRAIHRQRHPDGYWRPVQWWRRRFDRIPFCRKTGRERRWIQCRLKDSVGSYSKFEMLLVDSVPVLCDYGCTLYGIATGSSSISCSSSCPTFLSVYSGAENDRDFCQTFDCQTLATRTALKSCPM